MNLITLEIAVVILAIAILLGDLWTPTAQKKKLGYAAAFGLILIFIYSFVGKAESGLAFNNMLAVDDLAIFFKRFFLLAAIIVIFISIEFADRIATGISEFYSLILFALTGMMFAASTND